MTGSKRKQAGKANGKAIQPKAVMGAPIKYRPEMCQTAISYLGQGFSVTALAGKLDVTRETLYQWQDKFPDFSDAIRQGRAKGQASYEQIMRGQANGKNKGNAASLAFAMRNLYPADYMEKSTVDHRHAHLHAMEPQDSREVARAVLQLLSSGTEDDTKPLELLADDET